MHQAGADGKESAEEVTASKVVDMLAQVSWATPTLWE